MIEFLTTNMAPIMFAGLIVFLLMGYSVAFSLSACGLFFAYVGIKLGIPGMEQLMQALPLRVTYGIMQNETLLAIPFFTFMGLILERSGMAEDLLDTIGQLFGPIRGGLAYAVIFVGAMLAATTGVVAASVISMGLISLPIMLRYGYDRRLASGVIAASGTLAQIIPPSLVLIIMADQLGRSVGDLYKGAFIPGFVLTALYAGYVLAVTLARPTWAPALPAEARTIREPDGSAGLRSLGLLVVASVACALLFAHSRPDGVPTDELIVTSMSVGVGVAFVLSVINKLLKLNLLSRMAERVTFVLIPPLALIFLVLGTIFLGIATPTEGGAMGAVGALTMAVARRRLSMRLLRQAMDSTMKLSCFVVFILLGSTVFSLSFQGVDGPKWVEHLLTSLPGGQLGFLIVVNLLVFVLAFFLDFFELSFIVVPLIGPVAEKLGIDLVWFGVLLAVNMQTSFMHPPFGFALFYLRSVAPKTDYLDKITGRRTAPVTTGQIY
ncbi:MAG TPA: TRAP transporter large permease subunit, partial [Burkholderiaceae bacterium]